ncbi:MAG: alpha-2-macroglobulin [Prevotella sp.]|nr:alpha-2-macroglobulin [Prevotella sp.]
MTKKCFTLLLVMMIPIFLFGESYSSLWKKVEEANEKDLPQTEYELLQKIVAKAEKGKDYGQLLTAELQSAEVMAHIAPDSLRPAMDRLQRRYEATTDVVLKTVYQTALHRVYTRNSSLGMSIEEPVLTPELCEQLARVKDAAYSPFVIKGVDAGIFHNDLLHVVGFEVDNHKNYQAMYDYYKKVGNRRAACIIAAKAYYYASKDELDAVIKEYEDLPECGELAMERYRDIPYDQKAEKLAYIDEAIGKWGSSWPRMRNTFENNRSELTNPQFRLTFDQRVVLPEQPQEVSLTDIRNLRSVSLTVYKVNAQGDIDISPDYSDGYHKIKPLLGEVVYETTREYTGKTSYEFFEDAITMKGLPVGVYMLEFLSNPKTEIVRRLYFVTDVYTIAEDQPSPEGVRYVVVSSRTGQPIAGAHLHIKEYTTYAAFDEFDVVTDAQGEYLFKTQDVSRRRDVFTYTDTDKACPVLSENNHYSYYNREELVKKTCIYTDRAIYRPGQKVFVNAILYQVEHGMEQTAQSHVPVNFQLRDANSKVVSEQRSTTDDYGACSCEFTLPSSGLTGSFSIRVNGQSHYFRVEEYKRPTFHVEFPEVKQAYAAGDTLTVKGNAMTYAGVPVQGAKVSYKVVRRTAFWWWSYSRYWETATLGYRSDGDEIFQGEAVTGVDGTFDVTMPLEMPETQYPMYYQFVVTADVTDTAGETHSGQLSLPLGNKKQALSIDLEEKMLIDEKPVMTFYLMNAAGQKLDAEVQYRIDNGNWQNTKTNCPLSIVNYQLPSGKHTVEATCEGDSLKREFVIFSLDDKSPATETDDWFYQSDSRFPNDGTPVTIQVGSSDQDVHIVYSIFSGKKVIKRGAVDRNNQLLNLKLAYGESYDNGLLLTFAWVKNGKCYTHSAQIHRPLPNKNLTLAWTTFRDRLKPGQQEEWTLTVKDCKGNPVDAQLMATLYDQSLDMLQVHSWSLVPYIDLPLPTNKWVYPIRSRISNLSSHRWNSNDVKELVFSHFDPSVFPSLYYHRFHRFSRGAVLAKGMSRAADDEDGMVYEEAMVAMEPPMVYAKNSIEPEAEIGDGSQESGVRRQESGDGSLETGSEQVQVRENLNETAFFYPQLTTDAEGRVALKFTLPESLTTWRLMALAHTRDMYVGSIVGEAVAQKDVMIQPNVPRFLRDGDQGTISARIFNTGEKNLTGKAQLKLLNPETNAVVYEQSQNVSLKAGDTTPVTFNVQCSMFNGDYSLLICQMTVSGKGFSDGEQHYLPLLPSQERVTVTIPITQHQPGTAKVDLAALIPADAKGSKLTFEYTNQPAWLMIQALPTVGTPSDDNAVSQAASFYANSLGRYILQQNPQAKTAFELWSQESGDGSQETSLTSALAKNQDLKDLLLNETPWVLDADNETEQKQRLADFFDENLMQNRLSSAVSKLLKLQRTDGSWSWWQDMPGSFYMTVAVSEMLVRLNVIRSQETGVRSQEPEIDRMLDNAFSFMGQEIVKEVEELKKWEKEGHEVSFPSFKALQWLYLATLDGRTLPDEVVRANNYLLKLLKKEIKSQSIYEKALTAVILSKSDPKRAAEYAQSLKEWTVYREDIGRYYDTPRAGYSWYDYKIPTQTVAIEALQRLAASDQQTLDEMRRWLLQEKRTQAWDTPINSVNAVYAFLGSQESGVRSQETGKQANALRLDGENATIKVDGKAIELPKATAGLGYVKTPISATSQTLTVDKTSEGTSWGAVYAQFVQATHNIAASASGITVKRELLDVKGNLLPLTSDHSPLKVGDRIKMRITITADRDYDFVQVVDKRAACLEPVRQLSGWHMGSYCTPKDYTTNYYFDCLSKGTHVIESEYYIDRAGLYETGTCTVECAYAPEFRGIAPSLTLEVKR